MDINDLSQLFGGGFDREQNAEHIQDDERQDTQSVTDTQRKTLERWESDTSKLDLASLCNAYLTTYGDVQHANNELQYLDDDSKAFMTATVIDWGKEALTRLQKLIAFSATQTQRSPLEVPEVNTTAVDAVPVSDDLPEPTTLS